MSAHALLNSEVVPSILLVFPNNLNKFNKAGARMQDSIYHMTLKWIFISDVCTKTSRVCPLKTANATFLWPSKHKVAK